MERKKFDEDFYKEVNAHFSNDPNKIKKLFVDAFEAKLIRKDFATYLHTLLSGTCIIKDHWKDIFTTVKKAVVEEGAFLGDKDYDNFLNRLILGMLFLYADKASLLDEIPIKEPIAKKYDEDANVIDNIIKEEAEEVEKDVVYEMQKPAIVAKERVFKEVDMGGVTDTSYSVEEGPVKSWDEYYYNVAKQSARNSKCFSRRIGAILVKDKCIISTGYNGPPRGIPTCDKRWKIDDDFISKYGDKIDGNTEIVGKCPRYVLGAKSGEMMHLCVAGHAEENTILNCARLGISTKGTTMYMTCGIPCSKCLIKIIGGGVKELVVTKFTYYDESSRYLIQNSDIKVRLFDFLI